MQAEHRRLAFFKDRQRISALGGVDMPDLVIVICVFLLAMSMPVTMAVAMVSAATEQPSANHINRQPQDRDRNSFVKPDGHQCHKANNNLVANQQCDHSQDDRAGEACQIAKLAGAEYEASVVGV